MLIYPDKTLVDIISAYINDHVDDNNAFENNVVTLRSIIESSDLNSTNIDYNRFGLPFLWLYYFANLAKVKLACKYLISQELPSHLNILDLGCGSGASIVGFVDYIFERKYSSKIQSINIDLVDINPVQLKMFNETSGGYLRKKSDNNFNINKYCTDVQYFLNCRTDFGQYDIIIISNLLCEMSKLDRVEVVKKVEEVLSTSGFLIVVERKETSIIRFVEEIGNWLSHKNLISGPHILDDLEALESIPINYPLKKNFELSCGIFKKF